MLISNFKKQFFPYQGIQFYDFYLKLPAVYQRDPCKSYRRSVEIRNGLTLGFLISTHRNSRALSWKSFEFVSDIKTD
jgi:hypothetical protein